MDWLKVKKKYNVKSYYGEKFDFGDGFFVDIINAPDVWEAWIYNTYYGIRELMFSEPDDEDFTDVVADVIANFPPYRDAYVYRVMKEEL